MVCDSSSSSSSSSSIVAVVVAKFLGHRRMFLWDSEWLSYLVCKRKSLRSRCFSLWKIQFPQRIVLGSSHAWIWHGLSEHSLHICAVYIRYYWQLSRDQPILLPNMQTIYFCNVCGLSYIVCNMTDMQNFEYISFFSRNEILVSFLEKLWSNFFNLLKMKFIGKIAADPIFKGF